MTRFTAVSLWILAALSTLWVPRAVAADGTEVVVVIDDSFSMGRPYRWGRKMRPPSDPDRQAVLAALILEGLVRDTEDALTVVPMHSASITAGEPEKLANLALFPATPYREPLTRARTLLQASPRTDRLLVLVTDGLPTDYRDPVVGRQVVGSDRDPMPFDTVALGLLPDALDAELIDAAMGYLRPIVADPDDAVRVRRAEDLVSAMTSSWARALGSKPISGTLAAGDAKTVRVGRYVTEVLVVATATEPSGPFVARLTVSDSLKPPKVEGSTACDRCPEPATHFKTWRLPHDPETETDLTLAFDRGRSDVSYGVILRYDLDARLELEEMVVAGGVVQVRGWLSWRGERVDDDRFFAEDGFTVSAEIDGEMVPLASAGDGWFEATVPVPADWVGRALPVELTIRNAWMQTRTRDRVQVIAPPRLEMSASGLDLGSWRAERGETSRCGEVTLAGESPPGMPIVPSFSGVPDGVVLEATPIDGDERRWRVCARAPGCCGDLASSDQTAVVFGVDNPAVEGDPARASVRFVVEAAGWWTCWWPWLLAALLVLLLALIILGFVRGHDFDPDATVRIASGERQLARASAVVLREQPRGRRGFYRNARICLTASGEFVASPSKAALHVEAVRGGTRFHLKSRLERQDRRTRKFVPVTEDEALDGPTSGVIYRCGELVLRFE